MILEWTWFAVLTITLIGTFANMKVSGMAGRTMLVGIGAMLLLVLIPGPGIGLLIARWLSDLLPQNGSGIHEFTVIALMVGLLFLYCSACLSAAALLLRAARRRRKPVLSHQQST
jgi:hypothetical protein